MPPTAASSSIIGVETHVINLADPRLPLTAPDSLEEPRMDHVPSRQITVLHREVMKHADNYLIIGAAETRNTRTSLKP